MLEKAGSKIRHGKGEENQIASGSDLSCPIKGSVVRRSLEALSCPTPIAPLPHMSAPSPSRPDVYFPHSPSKESNPLG